MINEFQAQSLLDMTRSALGIYQENVLLRLLGNVFTLDDLGPTGRLTSIRETDVPIADVQLFYSQAQEIFDVAQMADLQNLLSEWYLFDDLGPTARRNTAYQEPSSPGGPAVTANGQPPSMMPLILAGVVGYFIVKSMRIKF